MSARLVAATAAALLALHPLAAHDGGAQVATPATAPAPTAARPDVAPAPRTLANGLDVLVSENHSVPLATVMVVVRAGAMTQTSDDEGVPHLFEHMLFKGYRGTGDRPFAWEASDLQAAYNGTTSEEMVTYYLTLPSTKVEQGIELLSRLMREPRFTADDLRTERFVVLGEMQRGQSEPQRKLHREVTRELWGDGWVRKNTIGEIVSLMAVTPKRLEAIYGEWYVPNNAALVVTGDVVAERVHLAAQKHFGGWRRRSDPFASKPVAPMPRLDSTRAVVVPGDSGTVTIVVQWQGPSVRNDVAATYDADVAAEALNDEQSGFRNRLVHDGPFQTASFGYQTLVHTGPISFVGTTTPDQLPGALTTLSAELARLRSADYFTEAELKVAAKRRRVAQSFELEEGVTLAHSLAYAWAISGLPYHRTYVDNLSRRSPQDLNRFVTGWVTSRPFIVGVMVPAGREVATSRMLEQFLEFVQEDLR